MFLEKKLRDTGLESLSLKADSRKQTADSLRIAVWLGREKSGLSALLQSLRRCR